MYRAVLLSGVRDYYDGLFFGGDGAAAVGLQQLLQIGYPAGNGLTVVDITDELAAGEFFHHAYLGVHIFIVTHGLADIDGMVLGQQQLVGVADQGIAAAAGDGIETLIHAAINIDDTAIGLDRRLTGFDRDMAGDDLAVDGIGSEFFQNADGGGFLFNPCVIGVFLLLAGGIIRNEIALEGGNLILTA